MADENDRTIVYSKENLHADDITTSWSCLVGTKGRLKPEAIASLPGGKIFVSDSGNRCVKIFSIDGQFLGFFANKGEGALLCPCSLTSFPDGTVAVFDAEDKSVKIFSMAGTLIKVIKDYFTNSPVPLGSSKQGDVVLPFQQTIIITSIRTDRIQVLKVDTTKNLSDAQGLVVSRDHVICCGMSGDDIIYIDRKSGNVVRTEYCLENTAIEPGLKSEFHGMCVDKSENLYIADSDNNRFVFIQNHPTETIAAFDCDVWLDQLVRTYSYHHLNLVLLCPKYMCIGPEGEIIILEHLGKVKSLNVKDRMGNAIRSSSLVEDDPFILGPDVDISDVETSMHGHIRFKCC